MSKLCLGLASAIILAAVSFSGCCAPMGPIGPGCAVPSCSDCSGCGATTQYIANGPLDALRNARRKMVCGSGCGEAYVGEWISTPPDAMDPCCGDQFVGGATKCRPFCWQPGNLFRGMYGQRVCSGDASSTPCPGSSNFCDRGCRGRILGGRCCGGSCNGGSCGGEVVSGPVVNSAPVAAPVAASSCGCTASSRPVQQTTTRIVTNRPAVDRATATRQVAAKQTQVRTKKTTQSTVR